MRTMHAVAEALGRMHLSIIGVDGLLDRDAGEVMCDVWIRRRYTGHRREIVVVWWWLIWGCRFRFFCDVFYARFIIAANKVSCE